MNYSRTERERELRFICNFVAKNDLSIPIVIQQLRSLWTAYCIHCDYEPDASGYDSDLCVIWVAITEKYGKGAAKLSDFDPFYLFIGVIWVAITEKYGKGAAKLSDFDRFNLFMGDLLC